MFRNVELTAETLLASACLPTLFQAIEIDGEAYLGWRLSGNPTITPLVRDARRKIPCSCRSIRSNAGTPRSAREILNRLNEVSFNATLLKELRMIALLRQVADPGTVRGTVGRNANASDL